MGQSLEYFRIHNWLTYHHGKACKCDNELCESVKPKRFEWALLKGKDYKKDRNNYIQLCPSCHRRYDYTEEQRKKQSESAKGRVFSKSHRINLSKSGKGKGAKTVNQVGLTGKIIRRFKSVSEAAVATGISQSGISNVLTNRAKTAGGYLWQF